eukprot:Lithocolla_globosa_v1_NODE_409_length_4127_cov_10.193271.p2 type:complete len:113 gc:universal NODE_409_length_4127_cov_10.193271:2110-2448(+)
MVSNWHNWERRAIWSWFNMSDLSVCASSELAEVLEATISPPVNKNSKSASSIWSLVPLVKIEARIIAKVNTSAFIRPLDTRWKVSVNKSVNKMPNLWAGSVIFSRLGLECKT